MTIELKAEVRKETSHGAVRRLRREGRIPASVYGKKVEPTALAVDEKELTSLIRRNPRAVITLEIPEVGKHAVMINEIQRDVMSGTVLHVDFHQINMDEPVKADVPVELSGEAVGVKEGGILQLQTHVVEVRCLPKDLPATISVDVSGLGVGETVLVSDLAVPKGVEVLTEPTDVVVTVLAPQKADETADEAEEGAEVPEAQGDNE